VKQQRFVVRNLRVVTIKVNEKQGQMDIGIVGAIVMLIGWAALTFSGDAPGVVHLLLIAGVFLLIYRITVLGTRDKGDRH